MCITSADKTHWEWKVYKAYKAYKAYVRRLLFANSILPGELHCPDAERTHVADGAVSTLLVQSLGRLKTEPDLLVNCAVDPLSGVEPFLHEALPEEIHSVRKCTEKRAVYPLQNLI